MTEEKGLATTATPAKATARFSLDDWPEETFNRLIPTQTIMTTDLLRPLVQVVQLEPADKDGKSPDHYSSVDVPAGHRAPSARGLRKLAGTAGVSFYDERRLDDGSDPNICGVTVMASMMLPTGQRITAPGSQMIDIRTWFKGDASAAEVAKFRKQFYAHVSTRAHSRAIRGLLSLRASYPIADINKPFAVVSYVPNTAHPDVRAAMLQGMAGSIPSLYGPETARGIGPGVIEVAEAPDGDIVEGHAVEAKTEAPAGPARHRLLALFQDGVAASTLTGPATKEQQQALGEAIGAFGGDSIRTVMGYVFGLEPVVDEDHPKGRLTFTAAQAQAIGAVAKSLAPEELRSLWIELAQIAAVKAGQPA